MAKQAWMYMQAWIGDVEGGEVKQKADRQSSKPIPAALNSELGSIGSSSASSILVNPLRTRLKVCQMK